MGASIIKSCLFEAFKEFLKFESVIFEFLSSGLK